MKYKYYVLNNDREVIGLFNNLEDAKTLTNQHEGYFWVSDTGMQYIDYPSDLYFK